MKKRQEMLLERGYDWNKEEDRFKYGVLVVNNDLGSVTRPANVLHDTTFSKKIEYLLGQEALEIA